MRSLRPYLSVVILLFAFGCRPADVRTTEARAQQLVAGRATTNEVVEAFGTSSYRIYPRSQVLLYLQRDPRDEIWQEMSHYPQTYSFGTSYGDIFIYFGDDGRAAGYHLNIQ
jgi:hypothetical protein